MKTNIDALLKEAMHTMETPDPELIHGTIEKVRQRETANFVPARGRLKFSTLLIAATLIVLTVAAGFTVGAEIIRSFQAGNLTIFEHEGPPPGSLPTLDEWKRDGIYISPPMVDGTGHTVLNSLEEAQEAFAVPLLVPAYLENGEIPCPIWVKILDHDFAVITTHYTAAPEAYSEDLTGELSFIIMQQYVGDTQLHFNLYGSDGDESLSKIILNGYEAIWNHRSEDPEGVGTLEWIQDGILVTLIPNNLSMDYTIKIAESLVPLQ